MPILPYMIENRLRIDPSQTQRLTTALLSIHGFLALISAPIIAHFADKTPSRKLPLLVALAGCFCGTLIIACTPSRMFTFTRGQRIGLTAYMQCGHFSWEGCCRESLDLLHGSWDLRLCQTMSASSIWENSWERPRPLSWPAPLEDR